MYNGDTIQKLVAAVDTIRERRSGNAVEPVFTNPPQARNTTTEHAIWKRT